MQITSLSTRQPIAATSLDSTNRLEQAFLEEMLKHIVPEPSDAGFSGGHGEAQFHSFLQQEYAAMLASRIDLQLGDF